MIHPFPGRLSSSGRLASAFGPLDLLFEDANGFPWADTGRAAGGFPALNVWADDQQLHVEAELPGLGMDDLRITVLGDELTLSGERQQVLEEGTTHHRRERGVGAFTRTVTLPWAVDAEAVQARLKDGVLTISLPKAESARPRRIEVKAD